MTENECPNCATLQALLLQRAQEIEQVKAEKLAREEYWLDRWGAEWKRAEDAEAKLADAALVSRAPQQLTPVEIQMAELIHKQLAEADEKWSKMPRVEQLETLLKAARWVLVQEAYRDRSIDELVTLIDEALVSRAPQELSQWAHEELCAYTKKAQATTDPHERRYWEGWAGCLYNLRNKLAEVAAPLPASAALQALIAKWRDSAKWVKVASESSALAFEKCADELEAALSRADQP